MQMPDPTSPLKIGTRGSPLALAQAYETRNRLMEAHGLPEAAFEIVVIKTTGDKVLDRPLKEIGGKGLFTREIEEALTSGGIDIAVHSMKDMPTLQPAGLMIGCYLPREDVRDAFVSITYEDIYSLPMGETVGSSSLRRRAQLANYRSDLNLVEFRGNVQTRLKKLQEGVAAATFLAMAGLNRLGMEMVARSVIEPEDMLPAVAQGAIGIERRTDDPRAEALLAPIHDTPTGERLAAERAYLATLDGSCQTPIAGLAMLASDGLWLRGEILRPDGSDVIRGEVRCAISDATEAGARPCAPVARSGTAKTSSRGSERGSRFWRGALTTCHWTKIASRLIPRCCYRQKTTITFSFFDPKYPRRRLPPLRPAPLWRFRHRSIHTVRRTSPATQQDAGHRAACPACG
jgi:hydroxymethylbilane synthase